MNQDTAAECYDGAKAIGGLRKKSVRRPQEAKLYIWPDVCGLQPDQHAEIALRKQTLYSLGQAETGWMPAVFTGLLTPLLDTAFIH